jgi:hypothetical protein
MFHCENSAETKNITTRLASSLIRAPCSWYRGHELVSLAGGTELSALTDSCRPWSLLYHQLCFYCRKNWCTVIVSVKKSTQPISMQSQSVSQSVSQSADAHARTDNKWQFGCLSLRQYLSSRPPYKVIYGSINAYILKQLGLVWWSLSLSSPWLYCEAFSETAGKFVCWNTRW